MSIIPSTTNAPLTFTGGRPDLTLQDALTKVSPQAQAKAKSQAQDFEAVFLNSMFSQMMSGIKGDGPYGNTPGTGIWRSMMTEQYSKSFAQAGGVGISSDVYRTLILQQANRAA
ncbi:MAG: flagellar rod assembly protein FlgJ [Afipia sp.]|nr:MAG: flagellar rod assembly protein FlgJ [Afipia sp.]